MFPNLDVKLIGKNITLVPMRQEHARPLFEIAEGKPLWQWYPSKISCLEDMENVVREATLAREKHEMLPFTMIENATNTVVGSSRYFAVVPEHKRLEIGWTWIGPKWQRTSVNPEAKLLMIQYAFETLGCNRVEFKTDGRNMQSRNAMLKLGLKQEGILRKHIVMYDGFVRDSVYFSVIAPEWPDLKKKLHDRLAH